MAQDRNRRDAGAERQPVGRETAPEDLRVLLGCGVGVRVTRRTLAGIAGGAIGAAIRGRGRAAPPAGSIGATTKGEAGEE